MAIEEIAEEVATNLEEVAEATRRINASAVGYVFGGVLIGASLGFYFGRRWNREKLRAEAFAESAAEVEKIREVYQQKTLAASPKPSVEEVIEERGYSTIEPPAFVILEDKRPLPAPVPVSAPPVVTYEGGKEKDQGWDYAAELRTRDPEVPYIIHQDEFNNSETGYSKVVYTYWAGDDVLCDEDGTPLPHADLVVGLDNLKFGHGSDDIDVVFVRNQKIEVEMEICRNPGSYEEEVLGLERNDSATD